MKKFEEYVKKNYDVLSGRENTEWSNFWWDKANVNVAKRYLLIGDSTARMVRSSFAKLTGCPVDMIGTSADVDDIMFVSQIDAFFSTNLYEYNAIFIQMGHHGRISKSGGDYTDEDLSRFKNGILCLIDFLYQYSENIVIETIYDSVIPPSRFKLCLINMGMPKEILSLFFKEKKDKTINSVTNRKNRVLLDIAESQKLVCLDINRIVNEKQFSHVDHIHLENRAKSFIAKAMLEIVRKMD